ncbi:hypothetical protein J6590_105112 [Homalodisca vitripennis]|nr:hypothetical protein J6590_105112 [Homalodisca vitripennis]
MKFFGFPKEAKDTYSNEDLDYTQDSPDFDSDCLLHIQGNMSDRESTLTPVDYRSYFPKLARPCINVSTYTYSRDASTTFAQRAGHWVHDLGLGPTVRSMRDRTHTEYLNGYKSESGFGSRLGGFGCTRVSTWTLCPTLQKRDVSPIVKISRGPTVLQL